MTNLKMINPDLYRNNLYISIKKIDIEKVMTLNYLFLKN